MGGKKEPSTVAPGSNRASSVTRAAAAVRSPDPVAEDNPHKLSPVGLLDVCALTLGRGTTNAGKACNKPPLPLPRHRRHGAGVCYCAARLELP